MNHYCNPKLTKKGDISQKLLQEYFDYEDGNLVRIIKTSLQTQIGTSASYFSNKDRKQVSFAGCTMELNRAIYLHQYGTLPDYVMPKDGNVTNCRIENLVAQTASERATEVYSTKGSQKHEFCSKGHSLTHDNRLADGRCRICRQDYLLKTKEATRERQKQWYLNKKLK